MENIPSVLPMDNGMYPIVGSIKLGNVPTKGYAIVASFCRGAVVLQVVDFADGLCGGARRRPHTVDNGWRVGTPESLPALASR